MKDTRLARRRQHTFPCSPAANRQIYLDNWQQKASFTLPSLTTLPARFPSLPTSHPHRNPPTHPLALFSTPPPFRFSLPSCFTSPSLSTALSFPYVSSPLKTTHSYSLSSQCGSSITEARFLSGLIAKSTAQRTIFLPPPTISVSMSPLPKGYFCFISLNWSNHFIKTLKPKSDFNGKISESFFNWKDTQCRHLVIQQKLSAREWFLEVVMRATNISYDTWSYRYYYLEIKEQSIH